MKTLVMTVIFGVTNLVNSMAGNVDDKYAYNYVMDENDQVQSELVYKADGKYLEHHLKYEYA